MLELETPHGLAGALLSVLELDEPRVFAFSRGEERLRFELSADGHYDAYVSAGMPSGAPVPSAG